jgi:hypothetical protein
LLPTLQNEHLPQLLLGEVPKEARHNDHAGGLVHYHHTAGTHNGAVFVDAVVVHQGVSSEAGTQPPEARQLHALKGFLGLSCRRNLVDTSRSGCPWALPPDRCI